MYAHFGIARLRKLQEEIKNKVILEDSINISEIKKIAGFDAAAVPAAKGQPEQLVCGSVVMSFPQLEVIEKRTLVKKAPMPYVPTLLAFREGPLILESYYNLENEPDVILVDGHGIAHPNKAGLATYIGVELAKPTIGVAKSLVAGELKGSDIVLENEVVGMVVQTKQYARPIFVSPGNLITIKSAVEIVLKCIRPPHKMPEPLHFAHRIAKRKAEELLEKKTE
ncbi:MAG: endonuclease V [Candidatus Woesearchaeota archaeon]